MKSEPAKILAALALLALLAGAFLALRVFRDRDSDLDVGRSGPQTPGEPAPGEPGPGPAQADRIAGAARAGEGPRDPAAARAVGRIRGLVVSAADGRPVEGAEVAANAGGTAGPGAARTGADGRFLVDGLDTSAAYGLAVTAEGFVEHGTSGGGLRFEDGSAEIDAGEIRLEIAGVIEGTVSSVSGAPIANAEVYAAPLKTDEGVAFADESRLRSAASGDGGAYEIARLQPGSYRLSARAPGCAGETVMRAEVEAGRRVRVDFALGPQSELSGLVLDSAKSPVKGARLAAYRQDGQGGIGLQPAFSDENGAFSVPHTKPGAHTLIATAKGYKDDRVRSANAPANDLRIILFRASGAIEGSVSGPSGPLDEFSVRYYTDHPGNYQACAVAMLRAGTKLFASAGGRYRIEDLGPGTYILEASAKGCMTGERRGIKVKEGETSGGNDLALAAGFPLKGRVVRKSDGQPVAGAEICVNLVIKTPVGDQPFAPSDLKAFSNESGCFAIEGLKEGKSSLSVSHPDYGSVTKANVEIAQAREPEELVVEFQEPCFVSGRVTGAQGTGSADDYVVIQCPSNQGTRQVLQTGPDGRYESKPLSPGLYQIVHVKQADQSKVKAKNLTLKPGQRATVDFSESSGCRIRGTVSVGGRPIQGCSVTLVPSGDSQKEKRDITVVSTAQDGAYALVAVPPGSYIVVFQTETASGLTSKSKSKQLKLTVAEGESEKTVDAAFPSGRVIGTVSDSKTAKPLTGAMVVLSPDDESGKTADPRTMSDFVEIMQGQAVTGEKGEYEIGGLESGKFLITVLMEGYATHTTPQHFLPPDGCVTVDVAMTRESSMTGRVLLRSGAAVEGASIYLLDENGKPGDFTLGTTFSNSSGRYEMKNLAAGTYVACADAPGCARRFSGKTVLTAASTAECDFILDPESRIVVTAVRAGAPVEGAVVKVFDSAGGEFLERLNIQNMYVMEKSRKTGESGSVAIGGLPAGTYRVEVGQPGGPAVTLAAVLEKGAQIALVAELK